MNPLFTDRYVLSVDTIILPEWIKSIEYTPGNVTNVVKTPALFIVTLLDGREFFGPLSQIRRDRNTGVQDKGKKEIFENDVVEWEYMEGDNFHGHVIFKDGCFYALWDDKFKERVCDIDWDFGVITGMVPFGEEQ